MKFGAVLPGGTATQQLEQACGRGRNRCGACFAATRSSPRSRSPAAYASDIEAPAVCMAGSSANSRSGIEGVCRGASPEISRRVRPPART